MSDYKKGDAVLSPLRLDKTMDLESYFNLTYRFMIMKLLNTIDFYGKLGYNIISEDVLSTIRSIVLDLCDELEKLE